MMEVSNKTEEVSICTGAACKAWDSEKIVEKLYRGERLCRGKRLRVCRVGCLNRCGGGASVRVDSCGGDIFKFRRPEEAARVFSADFEELAPAMLG